MIAPPRLPARNMMLSGFRSECCGERREGRGHDDDNRARVVVCAGTELNGHVLGDAKATHHDAVLGEERKAEGYLIGGVQGVREGQTAVR